MSIRFFIYGLLGWGMEIAYTGLGSALRGNPRLDGHTYLWMFTIYGLAVFLEPLHNAMRPLHWYLRGLIWVLVIWVLEYATGGIIRLLVGTSPWIYRDGWQVSGLIRLDMAPLWFIVGLLYERLHDRLAKLELVLSLLKLWYNYTQNAKGGMQLKQYSRIVTLWQSYKIRSTADLDQYLDSFRILFAFHSGKIENEEITYYNTREIFENGRVVSYTGSPRALFEQQNQKLCYEILKEKIVKKEPLSIELVKEIHKILTSGTYDKHRYIKNNERPGEFKKHDYVTGVNDVGSAAEDVDNYLTELFIEVNAYEGKDILKAATYLHARFEYIHPFADGNGRVGRTLMNYYLMTHNHPPLIIYNEDKQMYYECLQKYDEAEELNPLFEFLKYETEKTWKKALAFVDGIKPKHKGLSDYTKGMRPT